MMSVTQHHPSNGPCAPSSEILPYYNIMWNELYVYLTEIASCRLVIIEYRELYEV